MTIFSANLTKWVSTVITETRIHTCRKCHSKESVINSTNGYCNPQYHCKTYGDHGVLEPRERYRGLSRTAEHARDVLMGSINIR